MGGWGGGDDDVVHKAILFGDMGGVQGNSATRREVTLGGPAGGFHG